MSLPYKLFLPLLLTMSICGSALPGNNPQQLPINLQAEHGEYNADNGTAVYTGNVRISQGEMKLTGDKVVIRLQDGKVNIIEAWGKPATFHYVPAKEPAIDAKGLYMKYNVPGATIEIDKQAFVKQGKNETRADYLLYDLENENIKGRGVNMTFLPKVH